VLLGAPTLASLMWWGGDGEMPDLGIRAMDIGTHAIDMGTYVVEMSLGTQCQ
jgi:hypothetical protein